MDMRFSRWSAGSNRLSAQAFFWQPLHSPVSSLAVNHMFEELNEDVSTLCAAPRAWILKRAEGQH